MLPEKDNTAVSLASVLTPAQAHSKGVMAKKYFINQATTGKETSLMGAIYEPGSKTLSNLAKVTYVASKNSDTEPWDYFTPQRGSVCLSWLSPGL